MDDEREPDGVSRTAGGWYWLVGIALTAAAFYWAIPAGHGSPTSVTLGNYSPANQIGYRTIGHGFVSHGRPAPAEHRLGGVAVQVAALAFLRCVGQNGQVVGVGHEFSGARRCHTDWVTHPVARVTSTATT